MRQRIGAALVATLLLALGGCHGGGALADVSDDGPLSSQTGDGGNLAAPLKPGVKRGVFTFGAILLCSTDPDKNIYIDRVRYDKQPSSVSAKTYFRRIPMGDIPVASLRGRPQHRISAELSPTLLEPVTQSCKDEQPRLQVMTVMTTGHDGGVIPRTYIDYHVGSTRYVLNVTWKVGICGPAVTGDAKQICEG